MQPEYYREIKAVPMHQNGDLLRVFSSYLQQPRQWGLSRDGELLKKYPLILIIIITIRFLWI
jgi:hypothetical protein